jgi:hypothetical protein
VEYLNRYTTSELQIVAQELGYIADEGVEILVPTVYGQEIAGQKASAPSRQWSINQVLDTVRDKVSPPAFAALEELVRWTLAQGGSFAKGSGAHPSASAWLSIEGTSVSTWAVYAVNRTLSVNFATLAAKVRPERVAALAANLRLILVAAKALDGLEAA